MAEKNVNEMHATAFSVGLEVIRYSDGALHLVSLPPAHALAEKKLLQDVFPFAKYILLDRNDDTSFTRKGVTVFYGKIAREPTPEEQKQYDAWKERERPTRYKDFVNEFWPPRRTISKRHSSTGFL